MAYHNTTHERGNTLKEAVKTANKQDSLILEYFLKHRTELGASKVHAALMAEGHSILLTSIRRSLNTLANNKDLQVGGKAKGAYGMAEYQYAINPAKHPSVTTTSQQSLF